MVYLIHLERKPADVLHCIGIIESDANETLKLYYLKPGSRLMDAVDAVGVEWTVIRLWNEGTRSKRWQWPWQKACRYCPDCGAKL